MEFASMRIALVTGGTGGLGLATAKKFAEDGMTLIVADLDGEASRKAAAGLPGSGHVGVALDVSDEQAVIAAFDKVEAELGPIAVLAHFAGVLGAGGTATGIGLAESTVDDWDWVNRINGRGTFLCMREMARRRRARPVEHGRIITVSSAAGQMGGLQSGVAYSASKAAVLGLTKSAARDLGPIGVTVNAIAPGPIETPMLAQATGRPADGQKYNKLDALPLGRIGLPEEIAAAASYLASAGAAFVTGTTIDVNGGLHMH
ncbi:short-chain dehydrogenase [Mesorhizobium ephedrae]|uniref:Short-chain dehydrogenase n=2 Tax=Kumtagia ephedrae TaxID=2116701 RepID=A0A2P7SS34_9HYPH|nr:short-chain dehydrogenase [Mesorhizobium ephedrae]